MTIQVFVSYRRGDSPHAAGRLVDRLNEHFQLYLDVDRVQPGVDFTVAVREAVDVLMAGPRDSPALQRLFECLGDEPPRST